MMRLHFRAVAPGLVLALALAGALGAGMFTPGGGARLLLQLGLLGFSLLFLALRVATLLRIAPRPGVAREVEAGALFLAICYAAISLAGGAGGPLALLPFLVISVISASVRPASAFSLCLVAFVLEGASMRVAPLSEPLGLRLVFLALFGLSYAALVGVELRRLRARADRELKEMRTRFQEDAHEFRLLDTARSHDLGRRREDAEEMLARASVDSVRQTLFFTLELLKKALGLNACGLLWLTSDGERLRLKEVIADAEVKRGPYLAGEGIFGSIVRQRQSVSLRRTRDDDETLLYYQEPVPVRAFLGVPVHEGPHLRGVLFADRLDDRPFTEAEEEAMTEAAREVLRAIQFERLFADVEREKRRQASFFGASRALLSALSVEDVMECALESTRALIEYDFGAITLYDPATKRHTIARVFGEEKEYEGYSFADNVGLAAMVVKNRHYLPAYGELRDPTTLIYDPKVRLRGYESLLLLPLIRPTRRAKGPLRGGAEALGSLALGVRRRGAFGAEIREMLEVVAGQVAQSLENARMYDDLHRQATIDGLTGLLNRRHLMNIMDEMMQRAERLKKKMSLILTDIDHFKKVNDTYGHPVGDEVLREVAKVLQKTVRKIDRVGRYGGEEFCVILEETDGEGARQMAERLREEVKRLSFSSEKGTFRVSLSLGIATYPKDALRKEDLIECADQALYLAKHSGRDQARLFFEVGRKKAASA